MINFSDVLLNKVTDGINKLLRLDNESEQRLNHLQGRVITITLLPLHFTFQCIFDDTGVHIEKGSALTPDTTISGTPLQMMAMFLARETRHRFFSEDLKMTGNAEVGQQVVHLFDALDIDWTEHLSRVIGDVPAYHLQQTWKEIRQTIQNINVALTADIKDYVQEEALWFPTRLALDDLFHDIDELRMATDRLEAKIKLLASSRPADENAS
ncbi:MAG: SCP2 sterol-binding domain-containing protein [Gammaproteobacteria bacterium]|nr:SCP2 sterol-binding domain-containing protein [Gammaproteobacteria bacterium]